MEAKTLSLTRDEFNLNKLIIVATSVGKIFGIHSMNGEIVWKITVPNAKSFLKHRQEKVPFFVQRTSAHVPFEAQCAIIFKMDKSLDNGSQIIFFNPLTGIISDLVALKFEVKQAFLANYLDNQFLKPLIIFDKEQKV